jgi:thiol-disulfide isomerase/thioredoxin
VAASVAGFAFGPWVLRRDAGDDRRVAAARFLDLAGHTRTLAEWRGRILVLNFWATWCAPCREEIPMLMAAREKYLASGVEIVGIAIDTAAKVSEFVRQLGILYPVLLADAEGLDLMRGLGNQVGGLPYTVVLDRAGMPAARKLGALSFEELNSMLSGLLVQKSA